MSELHMYPIQVKRNGIPAECSENNLEPLAWPLIYRFNATRHVLRVAPLVAVRQLSSCRPEVDTCDRQTLTLSTPHDSVLSNRRLLILPTTA
jgi:hypothetical protein